MRHVAVLLLAAGVAFVPTSVNAQQAPSTNSRLEYQIASDAAQDCTEFGGAVREAGLALERDRRTTEMRADSNGTPEMTAASPQSFDLQEDLKVLEQRQMALNGCTLVRSGLSVGQDLLSGCLAEPLLNFQMSHNGEFEREVPIWHLPGTTAFFYESGMTIDADGAPNAYHPDNTGLDDLANAGSPGNWQGLAKNADGEPFVQGPNDPFPGYYVSATALADRTRPVNDPARYVDASRIPFIVLPGGMARQLGARPGDFAAVFNERNGKSSYAIFGDVGPSDWIGEGSMALAENLGIRSDARNGGARRGILYLVFPGSGNGRPRPIEEINAGAEKLVQTWGEPAPLNACTAPEPARPFAGNGNAN